MKAILLFFAFALSYVCGYSQNWEPIITDPPGYESKSSYVVKYITYNANGRTALSPVNMPLETTPTRITVYNTQKGKKYWEVNYHGLVNLSKYDNFRFHKYYLKNKGVYFYISESRIFSGPNNQKYYMIDFDGEIQFAL